MLLLILPQLNHTYLIWPLIQRPQGTNAHPSPPVSFTSGVLDGLTIRIEIKEIQKADIGRKYA